MEQIFRYIRFSPSAKSAMRLNVTSVDAVCNLACLLIALTGIAIYSRPFQPIWFDEFLQFAPGGLPTTSEAINTISRSIQELNHNQTGFYILLDYFLLKIFGASAFALRIPSLMSTAWMMAAAVTLISNRGFNAFWKIVVVLAIIASRSLMDYVAEARPYMPLAAAAVGVLTFYTANKRTAWITIIGYGSVTLGALMHPYFIVYWAAMAAVALSLAIVEHRFPVRSKFIVRYIDARLFLIGVIIYLIVGALTWMRGGPDLEFDPFQFIASDRFLVTMIDFSHLRMFYAFGPFFQAEPTIQRRVLAAMLILTLAGLVLPARHRVAILAIIPPAILIVGSLSLSALLSWVSYRHHYWILERQWVGSLALMPIAIVWYFAELGRQIDRFIKGFSFVLALGLVLISSVSIYNAVNEKWTSIANNFNARHSDQFTAGDDTEVPACRNTSRWVELANINIHHGGGVWPNLIKFYDCSLYVDLHPKS